MRLHPSKLSETIIHVAHSISERPSVPRTKPRKKQHNSHGKLAISTITINQGFGSRVIRGDPRCPSIGCWFNPETSPDHVTSGSVSPRQRPERTMCSEPIRDGVLAEDEGQRGRGSAGTAREGVGFALRSGLFLLVEKLHSPAPCG